MALAPVSSTLKWRCRYWLICTCIDGKMRTCASCSVLSRSKIHTRREGGRLAMRMGVPLLASDQGTDTLVGQNFEEQRVRHAPVDDVHALHAVPRCIECRADLRNHAARDDPFRHQVVDLLRREAGEELAVLVEHAGRIGEHHQLLGLEYLGQLA